MKKIKLTQGKEATVSDEDYEYLMQWKWHAKKGRNTFYAVRCPSVYMHREILKRKGVEATHTDHIDGDGLNNTRDNLRDCTIAENQRNRSKTKNNTSGVKGVYWQNQAKKWQAKIVINNKHKSLGLFANKQDAKDTYNKAAKDLYGDFHCP